MKKAFSGRSFWYIPLLLCVLIAVSCRPAPVKIPSVETKNLTPVAVRPSASPSERGWEEAYNKGVELSNQGKPTEASYFFSNALGASPGNVQVIEAYCKTMLTLSKSEGKSENIAYDLSILQILEGFLQSQIPLVRFEEVGTVLNLLTEVREKMNASQTPVAEKRPEYDRSLALIADGKYELPKTGEELVKALDTLNDLKEYEAGRNKNHGESELSKRIDTMIAQAQGSLEFLTLAAVLKSQKDSVSEACKTSATIAEYELQECEQTLRQMIALHAASRSDELSQELKQLKTLAGAVVEAKGTENWKETLPQLDDFKTKRGQISGASNGLGVLQQKLENLQQEASLLQNTLAALTGESLKTAVARLNSLKEESVKLGNEQSMTYNSWAMDKIKACLQRGREGVGYFTNGAEGRKTIGNALIEELGPIDRRYLTTEVSRCFDEVMGKYLAPNQLNPVKKETDLTEEGTILYTLNRMHETEKKQLSTF